MEKTISVAIFFTGLLLHLSASPAHENARIGFESLRYQCSESSNQEVCLVLNGSIQYSFTILVSTHEGIAGEWLILLCPHEYTHW